MMLFNKSPVSGPQATACHWQGLLGLALGRWRNLSRRNCLKGCHRTAIVAYTPGSHGDCAAKPSSPAHASSPPCSWLGARALKVAICEAFRKEAQHKQRLLKDYDPCLCLRGYGRENNCSIDFASSFVVALALVLSPDTAPQQFLQSLRDFVDFSVLTAGVPEH